MTYRSLGGPKTAKRKIQIRRYITEHGMKHVQSDPFLPDQGESDSNWPSPVPLKLTFKIADRTSHTEEKPSDDILSRRVDLDEADRFIAALRLPSGTAWVKEEKMTKTVLLSHTEITTFDETVAKLEKLRRSAVESSTESEEDTS
jgi:hypothetical protein